MLWGFSSRGKIEAHSTVSPRSRTLRQERRAVTERRFSPRHKSAQWQDALSRGHGCPAFGSAWHTNTDNAHHVQLWVGGCGTAAPGDMPGIRDRRWPCGAASGGHEERRPTPLGGGGHTVSEETQTAAGNGHRTGPGAASQARKGGRNPPPPAKRRRCTPPGAARHGRAGTEVT